MSPFVARFVPFLVVALGGGLGSVARVAASVELSFYCAPWLATSSLNLVGSVLAGFVGSRLARAVAERRGWNDFILAGFLGGFTTFSGFGLQTAQLAGMRELGSALWNLWIAIVVVVAGALVGVVLERRVHR